jgi:hypothetical protein
MAFVNCDQFYEYAHWGPSDGTPETDPNPRLEAYLAAARRGATVRILLDRYFDLEGENAATVAYVQGMARAEGLDVEARRGDPTHLGLHNKMVLASIGGRGYVHAGSLNGGKSSAKINRDLLISEVYYAVDKEHKWVEIVNPTDAVVDLAGYKIGDAQSRDVFEGMYRFPARASLQPGQVRVIASSAAAFHLDNPGRTVDFEFYETDPAVPTLQPYSSWGTGSGTCATRATWLQSGAGSPQVADAVRVQDWP